MLLKHLDLFHDKWVVATLACIAVNIFVLGISYQTFCTSVLIGTFAGISCVGSSIFNFFAFGKNIWFEAFLTGCITIMADMFVHNILYPETQHYDLTSVLIGLLAGVIYLIAQHIKAKI
jgi:multidrug transporter EmrE-like cation transporter